MSGKVSIARLRECLFLNPASGALHWKISLRHGFAGRPAGSQTSRGYTTLNVDGARLYAHRVVFALTHGRWAEGPVDHINGDRTDNSPANLREATNQINLQNSTTPMRSNRSGFRGVYFCRRAGRWRAYVSLNGRNHYFGLHDTPEAAHAAYLRGKAVLHPGWAQAANGSGDGRAAIQIIRGARHAQD